MALGGSIQSLGDWVQTGAGSEWHSGISRSGMSIRISGISVSTEVSAIVGIGVSIGRSLAMVVDDCSLGHGVQALGDGVQTSAGSEWDTGISISGMSIRMSGISSISSVVSTIAVVSISICISGTLGNGVGWDGNSLSYRVESLCDWAQTSAGTEWHSGITVCSMSIRISGISSISPVSKVSTIAGISTISTIGEGISAIAIVGIGVSLGISRSNKANQNYRL